MIRFHQDISLGKHTFRFLSLYDIILQHTFHSKIFIGNSTQADGFDDKDLTDRSVTTCLTRLKLCLPTGVPVCVYVCL